MPSPQCDCGQQALFMASVYGHQYYVCPDHLAGLCVALEGCNVHLIEKEA